MSPRAPSNKGVGALLAQFRLKGLDEGNQDASLNFGLLYYGNAHASPPAIRAVSRALSGVTE
jgi:hypothetical protein